MSATKQKDLGVAQTWYWAPIYPSSLGRPLQRKALRTASAEGSRARGAGMGTPNRLAFAGELRVAAIECCARDARLLPWGRDAYRTPRDADHALP
jgi:hypothetical protein